MELRGKCLLSTGGSLGLVPRTTNVCTDKHANHTKGMYIRCPHSSEKQSKHPLSTIQLSLRTSPVLEKAFFLKIDDSIQRPGGQALRNANLWELSAGWALECGPRHSHLEREVILQSALCCGTGLRGCFTRWSAPPKQCSPPPATHIQIFLPLNGCITIGGLLPFPKP